MPAPKGTMLLWMTSLIWVKSHVAGLYVSDRSARSAQSDGDQSLGWRPVAQRDHSLSPLASDWSPLERLHQVYSG